MPPLPESQCLRYAGSENLSALLYQWVLKTVVVVDYSELPDTICN